MKAILFFGLSLIFLGCSTTYNLTSSQDFIFHQGKKVYTSKKLHSEVRIEVAQESYVANTPLLFLVSAKAKDVIFDSTQVSLQQQNIILKPLSPNAILSSPYNFSSVLQEFNIPTPPFASTYGTKFVFNPYGGFVYGIRSDDAYFQESQFSKRILSAHYLKKTTLNENEFLGGLVAFVLQDTQDTKLKLHIKIQEEEHIFEFRLKSLNK